MYASLIIVFYVFIYFLIDISHNPLKKITFIFLFILSCLIMNLSRQPAINLIFLINIIFLITFLIKFIFLKKFRFNKNIIYVLIISFISSSFTLNYHYEVWLVNDTGLGTVNQYNVIPKFGLKYFKETDATYALIDKINNSSDEKVGTNIKKPVYVDELIQMILHRKTINSNKFIIIEKIKENTDKNLSKNIIKEFNTAIDNINDDQFNEVQKKLKDSNTIVSDIFKSADDYKIGQENYGTKSQFFYDGDNIIIDFYHSIIQPSPMYVIQYISYNKFIKFIFATETFFTNLFLLGFILIYKNKYLFENLFLLISSCIVLYIIFTFEINYGTYLRHKFFFWKIISAIGLINILIYLSNLKYKIFNK